METFATANAAEQRVLADGLDLERQLYNAERHYAEARRSADRAREEWRALSVQPSATASAIAAARSKFEAVAERCKRLLCVIEELEEHLD
jgi:hypothetical protein